MLQCLKKVSRLRAQPSSCKNKVLNSGLSPIKPACNFESCWGQCSNNAARLEVIPLYHKCVRLAPCFQADEISWKMLRCYLLTITEFITDCSFTNALPYNADRKYTCMTSLNVFDVMCPRIRGYCRIGALLQPDAAVKEELKEVFEALRFVIMMLLTLDTFDIFAYNNLKSYRRRCCIQVAHAVTHQHSAKWTTVPALRSVPYKALLSWALQEQNIQTHTAGE